MKVLKVLGGVLALFALTMTIVVQTATVVRQLRPPASLTANGKAERTRSADALDYSVATQIAAPPAVVWDLLTKASEYPSWNSTVVKIEGDIAAGSQIKLVAKVAPDKTFPLKVSEFDAPKHMVWEDGGKVFAGVRTFTLTPAGDETIFAMSETLSGRMLGMIEGSLPDFTPEFNGFAADLKKKAEELTPKKAEPEMVPNAAPAPAPAP
jgi:uncharacterized protein YndB with AHSA1/START domain